MSPVCECIRDVLRKTYPGVPIRVRTQRSRSRQPGRQVIMIQVPVDMERISGNVAQTLTRYTEGIAVGLKGEDAVEGAKVKSRIYYPACKKYIDVELDEIVVGTY